MTVSLLERQNTFGATSLSQMTRGNKVPNVSANSGVPTTLPLLLSQLAGAVNYVPVTGSASPNPLANSGGTKGTATIGTVTVTGANGTGSYTYGAATLVAGSSAGSWTSINNTQSGNTYTFHAVLSQAGAETVDGTWQVTVSDGTTSYNVQFNVNWN